ncbi:MAG: dethiobiotin synthase [Thiovulaceae bacterium]|nr:dethiobiotin synthase [Sulfurimonadaceae bacterium]
MVPKIFVSATNTNIGKTYTMKLLIDALSARGLNVGVLKPIETGVETLPVDASAIFEKAKEHNRALESFTLDDICPYQFKLPAAPFVAKGSTLIEKSIIQKAIEKLETVSDIILIEGAGGLMVPIQDDEKIIDMALDLVHRLLLVVPSRLGSINDTLLNLELLKNKKISFEWTINLYEDKESFEEVTKPYYEKMLPDFTILQEDLEEIVDRLCKDYF